MSNSMSLLVSYENWTKFLLCCVSNLQGHMKTHPGALTNISSKPQANDNDIAEDRSSHSANKNPGQQEEKQGLAKSPEKGDSTDPLPASVVSSGTDKPMDTTV